LELQELLGGEAGHLTVAQAVYVNFRSLQQLDLRPLQLEFLLSSHETIEDLIIFLGDSLPNLFLEDFDPGERLQFLSVKKKPLCSK